MPPKPFRAQPVTDPLGTARVLEAPLQQDVKAVQNLVLELLLSRTGLQRRKTKKNQKTVYHFCDLSHTHAAHGQMAYGRH